MTGKATNFIVRKQTILEDVPCFAVAAVYGGEQKGLNHIIVGCRMGGKKTGQTVFNGCEYRFSYQAARPPPRRRAPPSRTPLNSGYRISLPVSLRMNPPSNVAPHASAMAVRSRSVRLSAFSFRPKF